MLHIINVHTCTLIMCMCTFFICMLHSIYGMCAFRIWNVTILTRDKFTLPQVYIGACPGGHRPGTADTMPGCMHETLQHLVIGSWDRLQACRTRWQAARQGRGAPYVHARPTRWPRSGMCTCHIWNAICHIKNAICDILKCNVILPICDILHSLCGMLHLLCRTFFHM